MACPYAQQQNDLAVHNAPLRDCKNKKNVVTAKFENIEFKAIKQIYSRYLTIQEILKNLLTVTIY